MRKGCKESAARSCALTKNMGRMKDSSIVMQEVLSRPGESDKSLNEQEYWTLEILDWTESCQPGFIVQQARMFWSEPDHFFIFDQLERERLPLLIDADERYEARRRDLVKKGFVHSDMEF